MGRWSAQNQGSCLNLVQEWPPASHLSSADSGAETRLGTGLKTPDVLAMASDDDRGDEDQSQDDQRRRSHEKRGERSARCREDRAERDSAREGEGDREHDERSPEDARVERRDRAERGRDALAAPEAKSDRED